MRKLPLLPTIIGTGFGAGFWPWGPGTMGACVATLLWLVLHTLFVPCTLFLITSALIISFTILGTWATARLQPFWGDDPNKVVVDEMVGVWIPLLLSTDWKTALLSLLFFRFFDILKPLGIRKLDMKKGAFWVMADDLLAGVYSAVLLELVIVAMSW